MKSLVILLVGTIVAIILPLIDLSMNLSESWTIDTKFQLTIGLLIFLSTLQAAYSSLIVEKIDNRDTIDEQRNELIQSRLELLSDAIKGGNSSLCFPMNKKDLYTKLDELVRGASIKLELMYLGAKPPKNLEKFPVRDLYIANLDKVINEQKYHVKRLILLSDSNIPWIRTIANKYKGKRFFSLYVIDEKYVPSWSIQVIDDDKVIIINTSKNASVDKKHIFIDSIELNLIYHGFYRNIIDKSHIIIENGDLNLINFTRLL